MIVCLINRMPQDGVAKSGHTATTVGHRVVYVGGLCPTAISRTHFGSPEQNISACDILIIDIKSLTLRRPIKVTGDYISPRYRHTACLVSWPEDDFSWKEIQLNGKETKVIQPSCDLSPGWHWARTTNKRTETK